MGIVLGLGTFFSGSFGGSLNRSFGSSFNDLGSFFSRSFFSGFFGRSFLRGFVCGGSGRFLDDTGFFHRSTEFRLLILAT